MATDGLQSGVHVFAGESNTGKTAFVTQMEVNILRHNPDAIIMDFSLDDSARDKYNRFLALLGDLELREVSHPKTIQDSERLEQRKKAVARWEKLQSRVLPFDGSDTTDIDQIDKLVADTRVALEAEAVERKRPPRRLVVVLDNIMDTTTDNPEADGGEVFHYDYIARAAKDIAVKYDCVVLAPAELRKLNALRRPIVDDLKHSNKLRYVAKSLWLLYNEVGSRGSEEARIGFRRPGYEELQPVLEMQLVKNKFSYWKGRLFFYFYPEKGAFQPCDEDTCKQFRRIIAGT